MFNSKVVADNFWKSKGWLRDKLSSIIGTVRSFLRKVKRSFDFAVHGWNSYDWDYKYLFELLEFKLKRMKHEIDNGNHIPDKITNQSLRLCLKLLKKLNSSDYRYFCNLHDQKWGASELVWHRTYEDGKEIPNGASRVEFKRPNAITDEQKEQEIEEFRVAYKMDEKQRERDVRWLFNIMAKYHQYWWD